MGATDYSTFLFLKIRTSIRTKSLHLRFLSCSLYDIAMSPVLLTSTRHSVLIVIHRLSVQCDCKRFLGCAAFLVFIFVGAIVLMLLNDSTRGPTRYTLRVLHYCAKSGVIQTVVVLVDEGKMGEGDGIGKRVFGWLPWSGSSSTDDAALTATKDITTTSISSSPEGTNLAAAMPPMKSSSSSLLATVSCASSSTPTAAEKSNNISMASSTQATSSSSNSSSGSSSSSSSVDHEAYLEDVSKCYPQKNEYERCFHMWYTHSFLKGDTTDVCQGYWSTYQDCIRKPLEKYDLSRLADFDTPVLATKRGSTTATRTTSSDSKINEMQKT
ncbi:unnamed protein product [Amoebophrya sp. A25]|nr:unnamed protein product [Amoebophrya sp. A25]|eukprot:GSA25T00014208001.1